MAREIQIISSEDGIHYLLFGMNDNEISSFAIQIYIEKHGIRAIDWCESIGLNFITFMGGNLWVQNSTTSPRCNLFGEQKECKIGIVANEDPTRIKIFDSLGIHSDGQWEVESVIIPPTLNRKIGMSSKIPKELFQKREGVWRANFLRNMKSTSDTESVIDALNGEEMKGYFCYMILKNVNNPNGEQVKLFKVDVNETALRI